MAKQYLYFIIHKPFGVLSQFSDENENPGLGSIFQLPKDVYPVGRLDLDSEGLLLLTNNKHVNHLLLDPTHAHRRTYWVEVEGKAEPAALERLREGLSIRIRGRDHQCLPVEASIIGQPIELTERNPPVNRQKHPQTTWLELTLTEGKNRQVRRMTAAAGHPTLRLVRVAIEELSLFPLKPGEIKQVSEGVVMKKLGIEE